MHCRLFLVLACILLLPFANFARHISGGEMTYECVGGNMYDIELVVYRDCNGNGADFDSAPGSVSLNLTIFDEAAAILEVLTLDSPEEFEVDLSESSHPCPENLNICVEKGVYKFRYTFPAKSKYTISYQRCCRVSTVLNISNPEATGITFTVDLNNEDNTNCNSSPKFKSAPIPIVCINEPFEMDLSALDIENDELEYSLCSAYIGGGLNGSSGIGQATDPNGVAPDPELPPPYLPVSFIAPTYSEVNPMGGNPIVSLNTETGILSGTPNLIGKYLITVCLDEYRNNVLLSSIRREFDLNVVDCDTTSRPCNPLSNTDLNLPSKLELFPNPCSESTTIVFDHDGNKIIKIFDLKGNLILNKNTLSQKETLDVSLLDNGLYILEITSALGKIDRLKLMKFN